jgi:hypothetical protein
VVRRCAHAVQVAIHGGDQQVQLACQHNGEGKAKQARELAAQKRLVLHWLDGTLDGLRFWLLQHGLCRCFNRQGMHTTFLCNSFINAIEKKTRLTHASRKYSHLSPK